MNVILAQAEEWVNEGEITHWELDHECECFGEIYRERCPDGVPGQLWICGECGSEWVDATFGAAIIKMIDDQEADYA